MKATSQSDCSIANGLLNSIHFFGQRLMKISDICISTTSYGLAGFIEIALRALFNPLRW